MASNQSPGLDKALSPSIVRAQRVCEEKGLKKYRWSCPNFPELHPKLEGHLLGQSSRLGRERWLQPENVTGTQLWQKTKGKHQQGRKWLEQYQEFTGHMSDSWNLHPTLPVRDAFITGSPNAVHGPPSQLDPPLLGHQPPGYARWVNVGERWTPQKKGVPRVVPPREFNKTAQAGLLALSKGKDPKEARKRAQDKLAAKSNAPSSNAATQPKAKTGRRPSTTPSKDGSSSVFSQSSPNLVIGPYPPTPAYVRSFMRQQDFELPSEM